MNKKKKNYRGNLAYSTNPDLEITEGFEETDTLPPSEQQLKMSLDTKHRKGKTVTLIDGFIGTKSDLSSLGKILKAHCGTGGSAKDGQIIIQGDVSKKAKEYLQKEGYRVK